jgi:hypothetical protein
MKIKAQQMTFRQDIKKYTENLLANVSLYKFNHNILSATVQSTFSVKWDTE